MIAISWKIIWLFDSVQFDENAAKHQINKQQNKQKNVKYIKQ